MKRMMISRLRAMPMMRSRFYVPANCWLISAIATGILTCISDALPAIAVPTVNSESLTPHLSNAAPLNPFEAGYVLGPGDQIDVEVFGYEEYTGSNVIMPDGTITLSLIGDVQAAGRTVRQLNEEIYTRLNAVLVEPAVTVSLATLRPVVVTIAGEVQRPGPVQLRSITDADAESGTPEASLEGMPILSSALMEAGGVTSYADIRQVEVRRSLPSGEVAAKTINLWDAIWSENVPEDLILQDGDAVFVPRITNGDAIDRRLLARSSLSPDTIQVRVVGEVIEPGELAIDPDSSISGAIASAGGPTPDASLRRVELVRLNDNGVIERQQMDLRNLIDDFQVEDGDVVFVPKQRSFAGLDLIVRLLNPFSSIVNLINRF